MRQVAWGRSPGILRSRSLCHYLRSEGKRWGCDKASGRPGRAARVLWANPELGAGGWARGQGACHWAFASSCSVVFLGIFKEKEDCTLLGKLLQENKHFSPL